MPKESDVCLHSCHIEEPEFRSSVLHLGLDRMPCYTKAFAGKHKVSVHTYMGRLRHEDKVPATSSSSPVLCIFCPPSLPLHAMTGWISASL